MTPPMLCEVKKLMMCLPALTTEIEAPHGSLGGIRVLSARIVTSVTKYTSCVSQFRRQQQQSAEIDPDLVVHLGQLVDTTLPTFVESLATLMRRLHILSTAHPTSPMLCQIMFRTIMSTMCMLSLDDIAWPPYRKINPRLMRAVLEFTRWMSPPLLSQAENIASLMAKFVFWMTSPEERILHISPDMLAHACGLARNVCRHVLKTHDILPQHCLSTALMILLVSRRNLVLTDGGADMEIDEHIREMLQGSFSDAIGAARLTVLTLSRSPSAPAMTPPPCDVIMEFFPTLWGLEESRAQTAETRGDAEYVRALLACAKRYPSSTASCMAIVAGRLRESSPEVMTSDDLSIWASILSVCIRTPLASAVLERNLVAFTLNSAVAAASFGDNEMGMHVLCRGVAMKGSMTGLEMLLRRTHLAGGPCAPSSFLMAPYSAMLLTLVSGGVPPFAQMLSLSVTARKCLQLPILMDQLGALPACTLALSMISLMGDLMSSPFPGGAIPNHRPRHQLFLVVALTLQSVMRNLDASEARITPMVRRMPQVADCESDAALWSGVVEGFGRRHGLRLMHNCGSLACTNMTGPVDCLLDCLLCSGCRRTRYCSVECQRRDWAKGGHREVCGRGWWNASGVE